MLIQPQITNLCKKTHNMEEQFQTYRDRARQAHAAKLEELNALIQCREVIEAQVQRAASELAALASEAEQATPWAPAIESQDWTGQAPAGLEWMEE